MDVQRLDEPCRIGPAPLRRLEFLSQFLAGFGAITTIENLSLEKFTSLVLAVLFDVRFEILKDLSLHHRKRIRERVSFMVAVFHYAAFDRLALIATASSDRLTNMHRPMGL